MINTLDKSKIYRFFLSAFCLLCIHYATPWPGIQSAFNTFLILGLAPSFNSPLTGVAWAATSGWILEGTLKLYPHLGGTAFANMLMCLFAFNMLLRWPPHGLKVYWWRQVILVFVHTLLIHLSVRFASGPHIWGTGWIWSLALIPVWGTISVHIYQPSHRK
jgi:hypothetical protein